jgi:CTP synthase
MRLGRYQAILTNGTRVKSAYGQDMIEERHRHRYEFNNRYLTQLVERGFVVSGKMAGAELCETVELRDHPWMVGVQFHPEFKSKPTVPHPLFVAFVEAMIENKKRVIP